MKKKLEFQVFGRWTWCLLLALATWVDCPQWCGADERLGLSPESVENDGALVIAGGGALPPEIFDEFVRLAGDAEARLVIIPTAHPFDTVSQARRSYHGWYEVGAKSVDFLHAESRAQANDEKFVASLRNATGVWIGGGDQGRLADRYVGTLVEKELHKIFDRGGVVGGTSAGASILSRRMIRHGTSTRAVMDRGLSLVSQAVIDQHFLTRRRLPRLMKVLADEPDLLGLGIDEGTALVVQGKQFRVIGASRVVVCRGASADCDSWSRDLEPGAYDLAAILPE